MISASVQENDPHSFGKVSIFSNLWTSADFLWLITEYLDYETIAVLYTVNKRIAVILFDLKITTLNRIGSATNYVDDCKWGKHLVEKGEDKTYVKFAHISDLEEAYITENVNNKYMKHYGYKFKKLTKLNILF